MTETREMVARRGRGARLGLVALSGILALSWLLNPSWGPTSQVLQVCVAAAAALAWFATRPADAADAARVLALGWLAAAVLSALLGLVQYTGHWSASAWGLSGAPLGEIYANLRQRNQFATLMAIGLCSALFLVPGVSRGRRALLALAVVLLAVACGLTSSRTGALQWLLVCVVVLSLSFLRRGWPPAWRWGTLALAGYAAGIWLVPPLLAAWLDASFTSLLTRLAEDVGCNSRRVLWANAAQLAGLRPWFGWGLGEFDYAHYATLFEGPRFCRIVDNAHNLFLQVAVEAGIPAALALLACFGFLVWRTRPWRERDPGRVLCWAVIALVLLHSMVEYPLWYGPFQLALLLAAAHLWRTRPGAARAVAAAPRLAMCAVGAVTLAAAVWDYHRVSQIFLPPAERSAAYADDPLRQAWRSPVFGPQARFAGFTLTPLTRDNAAEMALMGERVLHYSPEPAVVRKLIEALLFTGQDEAAQWHLARFRVAFPSDHERFIRSRAAPLSS